MIKDLELLAPVGSVESLKAAVQSGADAVYLGGQLFNARHYASNFNYDELKKAVEYCQLRDVKVYVTVNILIGNSEIDAALDYVRYLYEIGVTGVIVQDLGLAYLIAEIFPGLELHGSTQMTINNYEGAKFLYDIGFTRVVLARETPIEEIKLIHKRVPIELEAFIHGALCISYSGQCLMSSIIGGRSGNRGRCAQPCRMPNSIVDSKDQVLIGTEKKYNLSARDLNTVEEIEELIRAGIISFKIEGRMKRAEYVSTIVSTYRKALDLGLESITKEDKEEMAQLFNRDFTKGLTFTDFSKGFVSVERPDNRGVSVGQVKRSDKDTVILLDKDLFPEDGLEITLNNSKTVGHKVEKSYKKGEEYIIPNLKGKLNSKVQRTSSKELLLKAKDIYQGENIKRSLKFNIEIKQGNIPRLEYRSGENTGVIYGEDIVEESVNLPLEEEVVKEQLGKLGNTIYNLEAIEVNLGKNCFMPLSQINKLRRKAVEELNKQLLFTRTIDDDTYISRKKKALELKNCSMEISKKKIIVKVRNIEILRKLNFKSIDVVYIEFYEYEKDFKEAIKLLKEEDVEIYLSTKKILYSRDLEVLERTIEKYSEEIHGVTVSNLGTLNLLLRKNLKIHGDFGLNIFNSYTLKYLEELGLDSADLSLELTLEESREIIENSNVEINQLIYGYIPVMTMEYCPMSRIKKCTIETRNCRECNFSKGYKLRDRVGAEFLIDRSLNITEIFNSVPNYLLDKVRELGGVNYRIDFNFLGEDLKMPLILKEYLNTRNIEIIKEYDRNLRNTTEITRGHAYRGIIN